MCAAQEIGLGPKGHHPKRMILDQRCWRGAIVWRSDLGGTTLGGHSP